MLTVHIGLPQGIYLGLLSLGVVRGIVKHGQPDTPVSVWHNIFGALVSIALLTWGGFFR